MIPALHPTPRPIVVGVERSERSRDALALARTLGRAVGAPLLLVAVFRIDGRSAVLPPRVYSAAQADEAEATLEWVARPLVGVAAESRAVPSTSVARGLREVAAAEGALAIVVGPSHRGALGRVLPGSVGQQLLRGAPCPVAVAPSGYWGSPALGRIRSIGVGFSDSSEAEEALSAAAGIAARTGASIRVLGVVEHAGAVDLTFGWDYAESERLERDRMEAALQSAVGAIQAPVDVSSDVVDGYADDELARLGSDVDLLICGSRGRGALGRVVLGSVTAGVLRKAHCPVLIVPRGSTDGFTALQPPARIATPVLHASGRLS
jgi:nucleotide-binding universal stress UspA family protein